jgi:hypothetical protein
MISETDFIREGHEEARIIETSVISDRYQSPFGLSLSKPVLSLPKRPCAHSDMPFDKLRANGDFVTCNRKLNKNDFFAYDTTFSLIGFSSRFFAHFADKKS